MFFRAFWSCLRMLNVATAKEKFSAEGIASGQEKEGMIIHPLVPHVSNYRTPIHG